MFRSLRTSILVAGALVTSILTASAGASPEPLRSRCPQGQQVAAEHFLGAVIPRSSCDLRDVSSAIMESLQQYLPQAKRSMQRGLARHSRKSLR